MPLSPNQGSTGGNTSVTITSTTANALSTVSQVLFGDTPATNVAYNAGADHVTCTSPAGAGEVEVTVVLANGEVSNGAPFYYIPAPVESTLSPTAGPLASGTSVVITGSGLDTTSAVTFGGSAGTVISKTDGRLTVTAPAGTAGPVAVSVTTAAGTFGGLTYTYVANPGTLTVTPNTGLLTGGTLVTITTTGDATTTSQVLFGSTSVPFAVASTTSLSLYTPPGTVLGAVNVSVTTAGGSSTATNAFTYV
ncbi:cell surface protein [Streptomyces kaniharaensis]|uniref:Cell surface protein n=1 Tax=Streptomyces kaniharaensis TaxID=212423 RepID=A0A6N7L472_9ACTN|nr:IPT/TIG domain-containing protein [Streptomyces kaniharaensis]MQS18115.1 cell surface protein [Streptomyces kaniharaensis]